MQITLLTPAEEQLMLILWKLDTFYMKDVIQEHPEPKPHQNTISTYLKILVQKQFLKTAKEGRIFKYSVTVPVEEYRKFLLNGLLENYFDNSSDELISLLDPNYRTASPTENEVLTVTKTESSDVSEKNAVAEFIAELTDQKEPKEKSKDKKKKKKKKKKK